MPKAFSKLLIPAFLFLFCFAKNSKATHIVGGNLAYEYLGPSGGGNYGYRVTFKTYIDCNSIFWGAGFPEPVLQVGVYEGPALPASSANLPRTTIINMPILDSMPITAGVSSTCAVGTSICVYEITYQATVNLPLSFQGYHLFYDRCCRVGSIVNLNLPGSQGLAFHAYIPPTLVNNSSPVFSDVPVPFLCVNDTASILNTAFDPDGDVLIFSFEDPYQGFGTTLSPAPPLPNPLTWPIPPVNWQAGYNKNQPFGVAGYNYINASTGYSRYMSNAIGDYVVAVEIKEYRNNILIGITRRDMQILVGNCPTNPPPNLVAASGSGQTAYTITEGDSICFPIIYTDQFADSITLTANGPIFDMSQVNPPATITTPVVGDSIVSTQFCWNTDCGQSQPLPYVFTVSVKDNGCPNKTTNTVYSILVRPFVGPSTLSGPLQSCSFSNAGPYSVSSIVGAIYNWTITGGTQATGGNGNSITVNWDAAGTGTVRVRTTSANGCNGGILTRTVSISGGPPVDAGNDTTICSGSTITIGASSGGGYVYGWTPTTGLSNPNIAQPQLTLTNLTAGIVSHTYILSVTDTVLVCTAMDTVVVSVRPSPPVDAGSNKTICVGNNTQLTASGAATYLWAPSAGLSATTGANPTASPTITTTYTVIGTDVAGCTNTDVITITIVIAAPADAGPDSWACPGYTTQLSGSGGVTYVWSPSGSLSNGTIFNPVASPTTTTQYSLTVTDGNGCTGTDTIWVTVVGTVPTDAGPDTVVCRGSSITIGGAPTAPAGSIYNWTPAASLSDPTTANPIANPTITTTYYITVTNDTCSGSDSVIVTVLDPPTVDVTANSPICIGDSITLTAIGATNYQWSPSTGLNSTTGSSVIAKPTIQTTYTVIGTDVSGCTNSDTVRISINLLPIVDAGPDTTICNGAGITLSASGGITYIWTPASGLNANTGANPFAQPTIQTTYTVVATDINGCKNNDSVTLSLSAAPTIIASNNDTICRGANASLSATGGNTYTWSPSTGLSATTGSPITTSPPASTTYTVTGTDVSGCTNIDTVRIVVNQLPPVNAGPNRAICIGASTTLSASGATGYSWSPAIGLSTTTGAGTVASPTITTMYYVSGADGNSCSNIDSVLITVNPLPTVDAGISVSICQGDSASLTATGATSYSWRPLATVSNPNSAVTFAFPTRPTTYTVTGLDGNGCINRDTVRVEVFFINVNDTAICLNGSATLNASHGGAVSYVWSPATGLSSTSTAITIATPTILTSYTVVATDTAGCVSTDVVTVDVLDLPTPSFTYSMVPVCEGVKVEFTNTSTGAANYIWTFGDGSTSTLPNPSHVYVYSSSATARLDAYNSFGCNDAYQSLLQFSDFYSYLQYTQPNVITPNFDGFNDIFNISLSGEYLGCTSLKIYDRWGVLIFEASRFNHAWDGRTTAGEPVAEGTYFYTYKIQDTELKGFITLIR